jgi:small nuclear ribonucleoprotein (snRNP)-like protein
MNKMLIALTFLFGMVTAEDVIILKSGRKLEGTVVKKDNQVHLVGKYGTIIFNESEVESIKTNATLESVSDATAVVELEEVPIEKMNLVTCQITTKSGRKLIGNIYQKGTETFLVDLGGIVKIDPFILANKEVLGEGKVKGQIVSGELCNVVLKSGRAFSGVVEEEGNVYFVSSAIGTVKVEKADLDHIEKSGNIFNLKEEQEKLSENYVPPPASAVKPEVKAVNADAKNGVTAEMTTEEMMQINNKAEESLKKAKEQVKVIEVVHELF